MKKDRFTSIFDDISDSEFENMLIRCGFPYTKVEEGKGGLIIGGNRITVDNYDEHLIMEQSYEMIISDLKNLKIYSTDSNFFVGKYSQGYIFDDTDLGLAA